MDVVACSRAIEHRPGVNASRVPFTPFLSLSLFLSFFFLMPRKNAALKRNSVEQVLRN